jgi:hypothetical protein
MKKATTASELVRENPIAVVLGLKATSRSIPVSIIFSAADRTSLRTKKTDIFGTFRQQTPPRGCVVESGRPGSSTNRCFHDGNSDACEEFFHLGRSRSRKADGSQAAAQMEN